MGSLGKLMVFAISIVGVLGLNVAMESESEPIKTWGDLSTKIILDSTKAKMGIPFITRSIEFTYPDEFESVKSENKIVRGIKHSNHVEDPKCLPVADIVNGGINEKFATVKVTSKRGCRLDSLVEFFIEQV